jgi:hypothetical protein
MIRPNRKTRDSRLSKIQQKWINPRKPFAMIFIDDMDRESWHSLSVNERRMLDALICHHFRCHQKSNGKLQIPYSAFRRAGITSDQRVAIAQARLAELGLIGFKQGVNHDPNLLRPPLLYEILLYPKTKEPEESPPRRFVWLPLEVMESREWCDLSINARRVMDRLLIENARHKGEANGQLRMSFHQFIDHGISGRSTVSNAVTELVEAGLLHVTKPPRMGKINAPNFYRITFYGTIDEPHSWQPSNVVPLPLPEKPRAKRPSSTILAERIAANAF